MRTFSNIFVSFFLLTSVNFLQFAVLSAGGDSLVANAIRSILDEYFSKNSWTTDVILIGKPGGQSENILEQLLRTKDEKYVIKVTRNVLEEKGKIRLNTSSILLFDTLGTFEKLLTKIVWQTNVEKRTQHLVFVPNITTTVLKTIQDEFAIDSVAFLSNVTKISVDLVTGFMFTKFNCRSNHFVTINRFHRATRKWENSTFYPEKYSNLHRCPFLVGDYVSGKTKKIILELSRHLNFEYYVMYQPPPRLFDQVDFHALIQRRKENRLTGFPFYFDSLALFTPFGELYSPLEQILLPFDQTSWIAIGCTLLGFFTAILIINRCPLRNRNFVYGEGIATPMTNLISTFLTGAQFKVPRRNFARFLVILISFWCMIIRTCHQSLLFKYLQGDPRKPSIKTLAAAIENNFTFLALSTRDDVLEVAEYKGLTK